MRVLRFTTLDPRFIAIAGLVLTSACASGENPDPLDFAATQDAIAIAESFDSDILSNQYVSTTFQQLPTSGSVEYQGVVQIATDDQSLAPADDFLFAVGRIEMTATFSGDGGISGTADNFIDGNDRQMTGTLVFSADSINQSSNAPDFDGLLEGQITNADNFQFTYEVPMNGGFLGPNAEYVTASGFGGFTNNDTGEVTEFFAGLIAQQ